MNVDTPQAPVASAPAVPLVPTSESPGTLIRAARDRLKLSLDELAGQTKLARGTLEALERDDFAALLEAVYVRGYYRKCAKVLNIPEEALMAAYTSRVQPRPLTPPAKLRLGTGSEGTARRFSSVVMVALVAVIAGAVLWYLRGERAPLLGMPLPTVDNAAPAVTPTGDQPVDALTSPSTPPPPATTGSTSLPSAASTPPAPEPDASFGAALSSSPAPAPAATEAVAPPPAAAIKPAAPAPISTEAGSSKLLLNFVSISWARVEDANGRVLLNRVVQAGERQMLDGQPPYAVFLGNAPGVQVQYQGATVDIKALIRDSATARFTVPLAPRQ